MSHQLPAIVDPTPASLDPSRVACCHGRLKRRRPIFWLSWACVVFAVVGCRPQASDTPDVTIDLSFAPSPPAVGTATVNARLTNVNGQPLSGAKFELEGNMNHAGMKPSFAELTESAPGIYAGELEFTMGGDWFVLATVTLEDGSRLERKIDVPGVAIP